MEQGLSFSVGQLGVTVSATRAVNGALAARSVADYMRDTLSSRPGPFRVIFASAPSQAEMLAALLQEPGIDWHRVTAFHMDEYLNLPATAPQGFSYWIKERFWSRVPLGAQHALDGCAADTAAEIARYTALLSAAPIDAVLLGIGENGHLAFCDPPAVFTEPDGAMVKVVELPVSCRIQQVNDGCFATLADVPTTAITLTIPALMSAARAFCVVPGPTKCAAVAATLAGSATSGGAPYPDCPASAMLVHPGAHLYVDEAAFAHCVGPCEHYTTPGRIVLLGISPASGLITGVVDAVPVVRDGQSGVVGVVGPGLTDLQVNGYAGTDFNTLAEQQSPEQAQVLYNAAAGALLRAGVTGFLPTLITNTRQALLANCAALAACIEGAEATTCSRALGIHIEGPFISPMDGYRGAHALEFCTTPKKWPGFLGEVNAATGSTLAMLTLAPELPGSLELIASATASSGPGGACGSGILVSLGHTACGNAEEIKQAVAAGARVSTHLGNGCPGMLPRHDNPIFAQLGEDGLAACMIADGHHLGKHAGGALRCLLRVKAPLGKAVLVSDAVSCAGCEPGEYTTFVGGGVVLEVGGRLSVKGQPGVLAGSTASLLQCVGVAGASGGLAGGVGEAWHCASAVPSALLGRPSGGLVAGQPADLLVVDVGEGGVLSVQRVYKGGRLAHKVGLI